MKKILLFFSFILSSGWLIAQHNLAGKVTDVKGLPIPGASVSVEGFNNKMAATNIDGQFVINNLADGTYKIRFSAMGFTSQLLTVVFPGQGPLNVTLQDDSKMLDNVVVIGYGTQRKRDLTGSIISINSKQLVDMPAPSFDAMLQGKAPGVQVTTGSGLSGSGSVVRIRGIASISAGADPLYVVDGIPITQDNFLLGNSGAMNNNPLASINPDDIEKIDILKDAAATAIYGSRGANGVIIITTKRGKSKGWKFNYSASIGTSQPTKMPDMLNSSQYLQLYQEAWMNDGNSGRAKLPNGISWEDALKTNTNWPSLFVRTGIKESHNLSVSKGGEKYSAMFNFSQNKNESYLIGNSYVRTSGRLNIDYNPFKWMKISLSSSLSNGINNRVKSGWDGGLGAAMSTALPIQPYVNPDGSLIPGFGNPYTVLMSRKWRTNENRSINGLSLDVTPIKNLIVHAQGNYDYMDLTEDVYEPKILIQQANNPGNAYRYSTWINNWNYTFTASYKWEMKNGMNITGLIGNEYQSVSNKGQNITVNYAYAPLYEQRIDNLGIFKRPRTEYKYAFLSYFGRVNWDWKNKYFLQVNLRRDASSKFGPDSRWGTFPSVSGSWIASEEKFLKNNRFISFMKVRASWGKSGNAGLPEYEWRGTYSVPGSNVGYNQLPTMYTTKAENPNLRWETNTTTNLALEFGILKDRVTFTTEVYTRQAKDVLMNLSLPPSTGFSNQWDNVAKISNKGIELSVKTRNLVGKFKWTTDFNIARNVNKITSIGQYSEDVASGGTNDTRVVVGWPVGTNYLVRFSHIDTKTGLPVYLDKDGKETATWDPKNRVPVGSVLPKAVGAITNSFSFKGFDLAFQINFVWGGNIYESSAKRQLGVVTTWNMREELYDRWRKPGDETAFPRLTLNTATYGSNTPWINTTMWIQDASFARLRNISLGYSLSTKACKKLHISSFRIGVVATNIFTITRYTGLDPEIARDFENNQDRNMSVNITYLTPPQEKTYNLTFNLGF